MGSLVNTETKRDVNEFIESIANKIRKEDAKRLLKIITEIKGTKPKIWGQSIVAFGKYKYQRKNGKEFEWFNVGFSPAKAHITLYLMLDLQKEELLDKLGQHKKGRGCLYIKRLDDVDMEVLTRLISKSDRW